MLSFENDYSEGAHSRILKRLVSTDMTQVTGYGNDPFCTEAKLKIRQAIEMPEADIYFTMGGTQTNQLVIDTMLQPFEGVIAAESGHVSTHEAGAIEFAGHKVLTLPAHNGGKIDPVEVKNLITDFYLDDNHEHMVFPAYGIRCTVLQKGAGSAASHLQPLPHSTVSGWGSSCLCTGQP